MFERNKRNDSTLEIVRYLLDKISTFLWCKNDAHEATFCCLAALRSYIYISVFVLQINETKTDTYNEKSTLSSLKSSNFPDTQRCTVTIGSQFYETIRPKVARLCSWKCEIYPMRNGAKLINRRYCEAAGNRDPLWIMVSCEWMWQQMHTLQILE